jgi:hypothetical protein
VFGTENDIVTGWYNSALPVNTLLNELEKLNSKASYFVNVADAIGQVLLSAWPFSFRRQFVETQKEEGWMNV